MFDSFGSFQSRCQHHARLCNKDRQYDYFQPRQLSQHNPRDSSQSWITKPLWFNSNTSPDSPKKFASKSGSTQLKNPASWKYGKSRMPSPDLTATKQNLSKTNLTKMNPATRIPTTRKNLAAQVLPTPILLNLQPLTQPKAMASKPNLSQTTTRNL